MTEHCDHNHTGTLLWRVVLLTDCYNLQFFLFQTQCWHWQEQSIRFLGLRFSTKVGFLGLSFLYESFCILVHCVFHRNIMFHMLFSQFHNQFQYGQTVSPFKFVFCIGFVYLYFWQMGERSASAVTRHCSRNKYHGSVDVIHRAPPFVRILRSSTRLVSKPCASIEKFPQGPNWDRGRSQG